MRQATTFLAAGALALAVAAGTACAQGGTLERRIADVPTGLVEFNFASSEETCGDGLRFMRTGDDSWYGSSINTGDPAMRSQCARGPLRVLVTTAEREIVRVESFVGPLQHADGATNLGTVPAREASAWLLGLAARVDGRPARDAIMPAVLADSSRPSAALLALAKDTERARETRRSAINWLARVPDASTAEVSRTLAALARDEGDAPAVRQSAVSALGRLPRGEGIAPLTQLAVVRNDAWLGREATRVLARSGDPRARAFLRSAVNDRQIPEELRAAAIAGLGGDLATGADAKLLRDSYPTLTGQKSKDAALAAVSAVGGSVNAGWLMSVARERDEAPQLRRRAITLAERAGATGSQLAALYDAVDDTDMRGTVITALGQEGSKPARDKLIAIVQSTELSQLRRRAITALNRFDGVEVREVLAGVAARP